MSVITPGETQSVGETSWFQKSRYQPETFWNCSGGSWSRNLAKKIFAKGDGTLKKSQKTAKTGLFPAPFGQFWLDFRWDAFRHVLGSFRDHWSRFWLRSDRVMAQKPTTVANFTCYYQAAISACPEKFSVENFPELYLAVCWDNVTTRKSPFELVLSLEIFQQTNFRLIFCHICKFSSLHFRQRPPEWALKTLDIIHGQHWGQTQNFSPQIFQNLAPTSAYVVLL